MPLLSGAKATSWTAECIWGSPALRPLFYNPLLVSIVILVVILLLDITYGKRFTCGARVRAGHHLAVYVAIVTCVALNNILLKYKYRRKIRELTPSEPVVVEPPLFAVV